MPTWPTTTISTTNLDSASDQPGLARADLKSMADVVNELVNYGTPTSGATSAFIWGQGFDNITLSTRSAGDVEAAIAAGLVTVNTSTDNWTFAATGDYYVRVFGVFGCATGNAPFLRLRNTTTSTTAVTFGRVEETVARQDEQMPVNSRWSSLTVTNTAHVYQIVLENNGTNTEVSNKGEWMIEIRSV